MKKSFINNKFVPEKVQRVFVVADFAGLHVSQIIEVCKKLKKSYPDCIVLPYGEESNHKEQKDIVYDYRVCTIEKTIFEPKVVDVVYYGLSSKKKKTLLTVGFKK